MTMQSMAPLQPASVRLLIGTCDDCRQISVEEVAYGELTLSGWYGDGTHDLCPNCATVGQP